MSRESRKAVRQVPMIPNIAQSAPRVSIILPTFNESKNVHELLRQIHEAMNEACIAYECIFVDDSNDTTPDVIKEASKAYPGLITLLKRTGDDAKTGLTQAFRHGFTKACGEIIVCMDTDLQHPPSTIPKLVASASRLDIDIAVASRYTRGGSAEGLDGFFRHVVSRVTNAFVHLTLPGTRATSDPMTGFFAFKRTLLSGVTFSSFGFKILVEMLASLSHPRVIDIPLIFQQRFGETSKATLKQGVVAYCDISRLFVTGSYGSEGVRMFLYGLFVSSIQSIFVLGVTLIGGDGSVSIAIQEHVASLLSQTTLLDTQVSSIIHMPEWIVYIFITGFSVLSAFTFLPWVLSRSHYKGVTRENMILMSTYTVLTLFVSWYILTALQLFPVWNVHDALSLMVFFSVICVAQGLVYLIFRPLWQKQYRAIVSPGRWFVMGVLVLLFTTIHYFLGDIAWWGVLLIGMYGLVIAQGIFALYVMVYAWERGAYDTEDTQATPAVPHYMFTAIVPCKHERHTIADTIRAIYRAHYPREKREIIVVIHEGTDDGTIDVVNDTIARLEEIGAPTVRLVTYNNEPVNKPHGLNVALKEAKGDFVTIFDAEDEVHPDIFSVMNAELVRSNADVVQSGVQLMNYRSNWYSVFNVLEYYFWFKSSLHFYAKYGVVPLGGVSVFFRRSLLTEIGGWDETCLTEDAEIGIRLSQAGAQTIVTYNAMYATQEETPPTLMSFIKQRTRWAQGFLQILGRGMYLHFPTHHQKLLALYVLSWPIIILFVFMLLPFGIGMMLFMSLPPMIALISNVSLLLFFACTSVLIIGLYEFTREYKLRFSWKSVFTIVFCFYPYTVLLAFASVRALYRQLLGIRVWEKTEHLNVHRAHVPLAELSNDIEVVSGTVGTQ